jgi:hypothetical protein
MRIKAVLLDNAGSQRQTLRRHSLTRYEDYFEWFREQCRRRNSMVRAIFGLSREVDIGTRSSRSVKSFFGGQQRVPSAKFDLSAASSHSPLPKRLQVNGPHSRARALWPDYAPPGTHERC